MQQQHRHRRLKKPSASSELQIHPQKLSFSQFQLSKTHINKFTIRNKSQKRQPLKIFSADGNNAPFHISYEKKKQIESNQEMQVYVYFKPEENRFYSQNVEIMLGNSCNKVELTAFSMPINKRTSKMINRSRGNIIPDSDSSQEISFHQDAETNFQRRCNQLQNQRMDTQINNQKYIGNITPTQKQKQIIISDRIQQQTNKIAQIQKKTKTRYSLQYSSECPVHDRGSNKIVKWLESKNNIDMMTKFSLRKFQNSISKIIKDERFDRMRKILNFYMELHCSKQEVFLRMEEDTNQTLKGKHKWKLGQRNFINEPFQFCKFSTRSHVMFTQYDNLNSKHSYHFDVDPRVSFDDWIPIQQMLQNGHEIMHYEYINQPPIILHQPILKLNLRQGAEQEYPFLQNKFQKQQYPGHMYQQIATYHTFHNPKFFYKIQRRELQELNPKSDQQQQSVKFMSSSMFNELNYELFNYIKHDSSMKYDVGFYKGIQSSCDEMIGQIKLQDIIEEGKRNESRITKLDPFPKKLKTQQFFSQHHNDQQVINNIQFSLSQLKKQKLLRKNNLINSCNKDMVNKTNRIVF